MQTNFRINIRTRNITDIIISFLENKKHKKEFSTQSSVFALSLILYSTKYTVTWHKLSISILFFILPNLYSSHFSICITFPFILFVSYFLPWSIRTAWATLSNLLLTHIKALSTKHWGTHQLRTVSFLSILCYCIVLPKHR